MNASLESGLTPAEHAAYVHAVENPVAEDAPGFLEQRRICLVTGTMILCLEQGLTKAEAVEYIFLCGVPVEIATGHQKERFRILCENLFGYHDPKGVTRYWKARNAEF